MEGSQGKGVRSVADQMGRSVEVPVQPMRIVSLVPSQTELLFDLGVGERVVGVTRYCVHPVEGVLGKEIVGGTKAVRFDIVERLEPDLVIGNKEENERADIERLSASVPVWMSDVHDLGGALGMIRQVGDLVGRTVEAGELAERVEAAFGEVPRLERALRVAYVIWRKPHMVAGRPTFIDAMLARCGLENVFGGEGVEGRYPTVTDEELRATDLDLILLASEPFPFDEVHRNDFAERFPGVEVRLVDGEMFSWYGSRLVGAAAYLRGFVSGIGRDHVG